MRTMNTLVSFPEKLSRLMPSPFPSRGPAVSKRVFQEREIPRGVHPEQGRRAQNDRKRPLFGHPEELFEALPAKDLIVLRQPPRGRGNGGGFTLIELLVVVAVISLLVAIAVPNYLEATRRADSAACKSNLRTLGMALAMYRLDFGNFPLADGTAGPDPSPGQTTVGKGPAAGGSWDGAPRMLVELRYITSETALFCPAMLRRYKNRKEYVRYAYNSSAADTFASRGGADDIERDPGDLWLARCVWVPPEMSFHPDSGIVYPHGDLVEEGERVANVLENVLFINQRVETSNGRQDFYEAYGLPYTATK